MSKFKVTLYKAVAPPYVPDTEETYELLFDAAMLEQEYCPLCDCFNGHALSCVKIKRDAIEHEQET